MLKKRILMNTRKEKNFSEVWQEFITSQTARGISDATIRKYHQVLHNISKYFDIEIPLDKLSKSKLEEMVVKMRSAALAHNSIATYVRVIKTFLNWCKAENIVSVDVPYIKEKETVKETYSDEELDLLLKRPSADCQFCEYRNWVIVNFLLNSGCRAATIRNIQNRDVNLADNQVIFRHTKNGKIQVIPLCSRMVNVLRGYMAVRGGSAADYLFCDQYGGMFSENGLRLAIARYNQRRGVQKTSIHLFRHTFARKYLVDCGGNAFTLQKLLGHSTLKMTKHYCAIYDADIAKNYDNVSPLAQMYHPKERLKK